MSFIDITIIIKCFIQKNHELIIKLPRVDYQLQKWQQRFKIICAATAPYWYIFWTASTLANFIKLLVLIFESILTK